MITYFFLFDPFGYAISPVSVVSVSLAGWFYMRGLTRSARIRGAVSIWRPALFFVGLTCILAATNAPLASLGHSLFSVHQGRGPLRVGIQPKDKTAIHHWSTPWWVSRRMALQFPTLAVAFGR